jgi:hypothetical protein
MHFGRLPGWLGLSQLGLLLLVSCWVTRASKSERELVLLYMSEDREFYLLKPALEHAFWVAALVALPLAAWLVIASQLLSHESERELRERTGPTLKAKWFPTVKLA